MLRRTLIALAVVAVLFLIVGGEVSLLTPLHANICKENPHTNHEDCASYNLVLVVLWHIFELLNYYGVGITAVATAFIGWFTATLWRATTEQAGLTRESIKLARDEFLASHRPKIIIHTVENHYVRAADEEDLWLGARVICVNKGKSAATITEIRCEITRRKGGTPETGIAIEFLDEIPIPDDPLPSGLDYQFSVESVMSHRHEHRRQMLEESYKGDVYCIGRIIYLDSAERRRMTGFCRRYDANSGRWVRVEGKQYDYNY